MVEHYARGAWVPDGIGCASREAALLRVDGLVKNAGYNRRALRAKEYVRRRTPKRSTDR
jgi:hypothetical protein